MRFVLHFGCVWVSWFCKQWNLVVQPVFHYFTIVNRPVNGPDFDPDPLTRLLNGSDTDLGWSAPLITQSVFIIIYYFINYKIINIYKLFCFIKYKIINIYKLYNISNSTFDLIILFQYFIKIFIGYQDKNLIFLFKI